MRRTTPPAYTVAFDLFDQADQQKAPTIHLLVKRGGKAIHPEDDEDEGDLFGNLD